MAEEKKKILLRKGRGNGRSRAMVVREPDFLGKWEYAPAPESTSHLTIRPSYDLFVGGKWVSPRSKKSFSTINPATEEQLAMVAEAGEADVDAAVRAASRAY